MASLDAGAVGLRRGALVEVDPECPGCPGITRGLILGSGAERGQWEVLMDDGRFMTLKDDCLMVVGDSSGEAGCAVQACRPTDAVRSDVAALREMVFEAVD
mmetsp:Transcript_57715/g.130167  ORF Transcript_57715/g.130167 Transcript_57715/m.130167 type:complete len:101 (-) Transcript_57715:21-323(-)